MLLGSSKALHLSMIRMCTTSAIWHLATNHEFVRLALRYRSGDNASTPIQRKLFSHTSFPAFTVAPFRVCPCSCCIVQCSAYFTVDISREGSPSFSLGNSERFAKMPIGSRGAYTFVDVLLAIILPPLGVFLKYGLQSEFWICLVLTILGYLPGIIYAIYVIVG